MLISSHFSTDSQPSEHTLNRMGDCNLRIPHSENWCQIFWMSNDFDFDQTILGWRLDLAVELVFCCKNVGVKYGLKNNFVSGQWVHEKHRSISFLWLTETEPCAMEVGMGGLRSMAEAEAAAEIIEEFIEWWWLRLVEAVLIGTYFCSISEPGVAGVGKSGSGSMGVAVGAEGAAIALEPASVNICASETGMWSGSGPVRSGTLSLSG